VVEVPTEALLMLPLRSHVTSEHPLGRVKISEKSSASAISGDNTVVVWMSVTMCYRDQGASRRAGLMRGFRRATRTQFSPS
jgi:hypothetical protein